MVTIQDATKLLSEVPEIQRALLPALVRTGDAIRDALVEDEGRPQRAAVRKKLDTLHRAAKTVASLLNDPDLSGLLSHGQAHRRSDGRDITPGQMCTLADDTAWVRDTIPNNPGTNKLNDVIGVASGRLLCATAGIKFFELSKRLRPNKKNTSTQEFCALLWKAAGGTVSNAVRNGKVADMAVWERHIEGARNPTNIASCLVARMTIDDIIDGADLGGLLYHKK